ncbi:MAG: DUF4115 domain-containing protein, partial [Magnetococcales bacterium]|nr:DUF4115 domain-containing protein [Magnetococcales bacterium]
PKPEVKPEPKPEVKPEPKPEVKPVAKPESKSAPVKPDAKSGAKPETKPGAAVAEGTKGAEKADPKGEPEPPVEEGDSEGSGSWMEALMNRFTSRDASSAPETEPAPVEPSAPEAVPARGAALEKATHSGKTTPPAHPEKATPPAAPEKATPPAVPEKATPPAAVPAPETVKPGALSKKKWPKGIKERYPEPVSGEADLLPESANAISLQAKELVWVQIHDASGAVVKDMVLQPGYLFRVPDGGGYSATLGNAASVRVRVGHQEIPGVGAAGEMVEGLKLNPETLRKRAGGR